MTRRRKSNPPARTITYVVNLDDLERTDAGIRQAHIGGVQFVSTDDLVRWLTRPIHHPSIQPGARAVAEALGRWAITWDLERMEAGE